MSYEALARELRPVLYEYYATLKKYGDLEYCDALDKADKETNIDKKIDTIVKKYFPNARSEPEYLSDYDLSLGLYDIGGGKEIEIIMAEFNYVCDIHKLKEVLPEEPEFYLLVYEDRYLEKSIKI